MSSGNRGVLDRPHDQATRDVRDAVKHQGYGVLTGDDALKAVAADAAE